MVYLKASSGTDELPQVDGSQISRRIERRRKEKAEGWDEQLFGGEGGGGTRLYH
jgi:hypothetical protein